jgi:prepilin peptidase CpaA
VNWAVVLANLWLLTGVAQAMLLLMAAWTDVSTRLIPNGACLAIAAIGAAAQAWLGPLALAQSLGVAAALFVLLLILHSRSLLGGGDVKLLVALALGFSPAGTVRLLAATAFAGGLLALLHLSLRRLPRPALAGAGASACRRVYAAERWRIIRHAPLPYGVAIAFGGVWALLTNTGG